MNSTAVDNDSAVVARFGFFLAQTCALVCISIPSPKHFTPPPFGSNRFYRPSYENHS